MIRTLRRAVAGYVDATPSAVRWALVIAWAAGLWFLSSRSGSGGESVWLFSVIWNSGHIVVYFVLSILVLAALEWPEQGRRRAAFAVLIAGTYGVIDEIHQSFVPGRDCSVLDIVNDFLGAVLGVWLGFEGTRVSSRGHESGSKPA